MKQKKQLVMIVALLPVLGFFGYDAWVKYQNSPAQLAKKSAQGGGAADKTAAAGGGDEAGGGGGASGNGAKGTGGAKTPPEPRPAASRTPSPAIPMAPPSVAPISPIDASGNGEAGESGDEIDFEEIDSMIGGATEEDDPVSKAQDERERTNMARETDPFVVVELPHEGEAIIKEPIK
ncbi:MAG: hypothetical protein HZA54_12800, partial [Planctomycetes bacterium]|nr:hypothetical protein [Planctomycetota bacterium]